MRFLTPVAASASHLPTQARAANDNHFHPAARGLGSQPGMPDLRAFGLLAWALRSTHLPRVQG